MSYTKEQYQRRFRLLAAATLIWGVGGTYWYVCGTEGLCQSNSSNTSQNEDAKSNITVGSANGAIGQSSEPLAENPGNKRFLFLPDSADPSEDNSDYLNKVATYLKQHTAATVSVAGFTTDLYSEIPDADTAISMSRADYVKNQLIARGISADKISISVGGQSDQIADTSTEEGAAQNRRAEVLVNSNEQEN